MELSSNSSKEVFNTSEIAKQDTPPSLAVKFYSTMDRLSENERTSLIDQLSEEKYLEWSKTHTGTYEEYQHATIDNFTSESDDEIEENLEVSTHLENTGVVKIADLRGFDPNFALELQDAFDEAKNDFPDLEINYCGTIQNQVDGIRQIIMEKYEAKLKALNGDEFSDAYYKKIATNYADNVISKYGLDDTNGVFAWSMNLPGKTYEKYNGIGINEIYASDNEYFTEQKIDEVYSGHKPIGCDTSRATVDHELGHEIDKLVGASKDEYIIGLYDQMIDDGNAEEVLSGYSQTNVSEFIAEAYSEYRNNPNPREYAVKVYERLIELYHERGNIS